MKFTEKHIKSFIALAQSRITGYSAIEQERKHAFHRDGRALLVEIAKRVELSKVKIHSNKAGPAIGGEVILESTELHVQFGAGCEHGILYRKGSDGPNQWMPWGTLLDMPALVLVLCGAIRGPS